MLGSPAWCGASTVAAGVSHTFGDPVLRPALIQSLIIQCKVGGCLSFSEQELLQPQKGTPTCLAGSRGQMRARGYTQLCEGHPVCTPEAQNRSLFPPQPGPPDSLLSLFQFQEVAIRSLIPGSDNLTSLTKLY